MRIPIGLASFFVWAGIAAAANPEHVARTLNVAQFSSCPACDLTGADLRERFLRLGNFPGTDFTGAQLDKSDMAGAILWEAKLVRGSFVYTNLSGAQMEKTDLTDANFRNAWLSYAVLHDARFGAADLTGTVLLGAQLYGADLSAVKGLTQAQLAFTCGDAQTRLPAGLKLGFCRS